MKNDRGDDGASHVGSTRRSGSRSILRGRVGRRTISLRVRLAVFVLLVMALVAAERSVSIASLHDDALAASRTRVMDVVDQGVNEYDLTLTAARSTLAALAALNIGGSDCADLSAVVGIAHSIESLFIADADGIVSCSTLLGGIGRDVGEREYFRIAMRGVGNLGTVSRRLITPLPAIYLAEPLFDDDGQARGAIVARVGIDELFPKSFAVQLGADAEAMVVDPDGGVITAFPDRQALVGTNLAHTGMVGASMSRSRGTVVAEGPDGRTRLYGFSRLPSSNMHLIVGLDMTAVTREVQRATWQAAATLLAAIAVMLVGLWLVGETLIVAPVQALSRRFTRFGQGERDEGGEGRTVIAELQPLVAAFEAMAVELTRREEALRGANRRLSSLASLDALTGIANRRSFDAVFAVQWSSARRLALLMVDVDHFKAYNDHFGHMEGDRCIRAIAQALAAAVRGTDVVARIGGEEFAVLMPGAALPEATEVAEGLRRAVAQLALEHAPAISGFVTISIGGAACPPAPELRATDLMVAADHALYAAKQAGRDRVCTVDEVQPKRMSAAGRTGEDPRLGREFGPRKPPGG